MDSQTVRTALGTLQVNPDADEAYQQLREGLASGGDDLSPQEALSLLQAARERHAARGEAQAVSRLLEESLSVSNGSSDSVPLLRELANVQLEQLFDGRRALDTLRRAAQLSDDPQVAEELEQLESRAGNWQHQADKYIAEADNASDDEYRSAMLMRAAEAEVCFSEAPRFSTLVEYLEMALRLDSSNVPAARLLEAIYRKRGDLDALERVLERTADRAPDQKERIAAGVRLARLYQHQKGEEERAAAAFDRVLDSDPAQPDAVEFLTDYYEKHERWDDLVRVYERPLKTRGNDQERLGDMLQVAMLHWKKRGALADAEPWFDRIRELQPAHEQVLDFYREYKASLNDDAGLVQVLQAAQRALPPDSRQSSELSKELATHAESQASAHKEIEKYKSALRENPEDEDVREKLKTLYKQTQGHNALVELLRQQLERTDEKDYEKRLAIMREIAGVYREYVKSDTALVGVLNQIVQLDGKLDEHDVDEVRELVALYEKLGRPRDLLASQKLLAEIVPDVDEKKALYRQVGRRWLEQYSNVQHAMEAFAALHALDPRDEEAMERLEDLYRKRRAWNELFSLYEEQLKNKEGEARVPLLREMGQLAAERLGRVEDALGYYREALDLAPERIDLMDRMEKHAERSKSWEALADVLERRLRVLPEDEGKLPVLQKLGGVYSDHLKDLDRAIDTWRRVVDVQPGHSRAMRVLRDMYLKQGRLDDLEELYASQEDLEGLAEVLSTAADRTKDPERKLELSYRAARVYEERLGQSARAVRSYERILSIDSKDARAIARLLPLYEEDEKWVRVPPLLEVQVELADSDEEKIRVLEQLVQVTGERLGDRKRAVGYARQAYEIAPDNPRTLELLDSTSRTAGIWDEMVQALETRLREVQRRSSQIPPAPDAQAKTPSESPSKGRRRRRRKKGRQSSTPPPAEAKATGPSETPPEDSQEIVEARRNVSLRLARVLGEELGKVDDAVHRLKQLATSHPKDADVLSTLDAMLRRESRPDDIRWLFEHRQDHADSPSDKANILAEWASYEEKQLEEPKNALSLYRRALSHEPDDAEILEAVARLALEADDAAGAADAVEKHRDLLAGADRADKEADLAELYQNRLSRPDDALTAAQRALEGGVEPGRVIPVLQQLVEVPEVRAEAARILSEQYEAGGDARQEADALRALISETSDPAEKSELTQRLANIYQEKLAEPGGALTVLLEGVKEAPEDPLMWDRAGELAGLSGRSTDLADAYENALKKDLAPDLKLDLARRAASLHEDVLADAAGAVPHYERILAIEPDDAEAFGRLKEILTAEERWQQLEELYDREIQRLTDDVRRVEMLAEVALLAEDIMGEAERAVDYHRRIREIDPDYPVSLEALDRLYTRLNQKENLFSILEKRAEQAIGEERHKHLVRFAQLALELHRPKDAISAVERVLEDDPNNYEARDVGEQLLDIGSVRVRAAKALEVVYEARDEMRDLVRVLGVRVEELRPSADEQLDEATVQQREDERRDLLRRVATLRDDRLHDDEGSFDVFAELVPLDPVDADLRERLVDSGRRLGRNEQVVQVLKDAAERADVPALRGEILLAAADIQTTQVDDGAGAEATYREVVQLRDEEPELALAAAKQLEGILVSADRGQDLIENLKLQIELETDFERKPELLARLAQLSSDVLGDDSAAISAWEARLAENPDDLEALTALSELYEKTGRYSDLARVLEQRRDAAMDDQERLSISRRLAEVQEKHLEETELAIESYQVLLDEGGPDASVLRALSRLYEKAERWDDLADVHERQTEVLEEEGEQLAALAALGRVRGEHLQDVPGALDAYRRALSLNPSHEDSRQELGKLLSSEDSVIRLEAAEILQPIYEAEGSHENLLNVVEVQAQSSDDPAYRAERFEAATRLAEDALDDPGRAMGFATRGIRAAAVQGDLGDWFETLDRLARASDSRNTQVEVLETVVGELFDVEQQLRAQTRVAVLRRDELSDTQGAIEAYRKCLELQPDYRDGLVALEALYEKTEDWPSLLEVLEQREQAAESDDERKALAYRKADILSSKLEDSERAIETYEGILDIALEDRAISALEELYEKAERFDDLAALIQRRIDEGQASVPDLRTELASVHAEKQGELDRGLDELEQALEEDSQHQPSVKLLERLRDATEDPMQLGRIAGLLEPVYMVRADFDSVLGALELRLKGSDDPEERRELVTRIAQIHEEQREDYGAALEITAKLLADDPSDTATLDEMERLAKVAGAQRRLAELLSERVEDVDVEDEMSARLCRRAAEIFAQHQEDEKALSLYRRALAFEPESKELFEAVDELLKRSGTARERVDLHRNALEHRFEPDEQVVLLHVIADLEENQLREIDEAIAAHRQVLEVDDRNTVSLDALTRLYIQTENWEDLAELYQARAEPMDPQEAAPYRLELAELYNNRLERPEASLDQLEDILRDLPTHETAIERIEAFREHEELKERAVEILRPIYESQDDWHRLIRLNEDRFSLADDPSEKVAILRETAELWENRGDNPGRASRVLSKAFKLDPEDESTREELERLAAITEDWGSLAELYDDVLDAHPDLGPRVEVVGRLAQLYDEYLDDPRRALTRYQELHTLTEGELEPVEATTRLATLLGDWKALDQSLADLAELILDEDDRIATLVRLGDLRHRVLDDDEGALTAYERAFEGAEQNVDVCDRLIELYEERKDAPRLVDLYTARVEIPETTDDERYELLKKAAKLLETELSEPPRAIDCLGQALSARPGDSEIIAELNRLYRAEEMWPDLLDNLRLEAGTAEDVEHRLKVRHEIADILANKMESHEEAIEAYGVVLDERPDDQSALDAVFTLAEREEHLRQQAADLLVPALRQTSLRKRLVKALELRFSVEQEPTVRVETLRTIAQVQEEDLQDQRAAFETLLRAIAETPEASDLYDELERLAAGIDGWARFVDALEERAKDVFEPDLARDMWVRVGQIAEEKLGEKKRAIAAYEQATEQAGDQLELLDALDRLHTEQDNTSAVVDLLDRRMALADTDEAQARLLCRQGQLQLEKQKEPAEALESLRQALGRDVHNQEASDLLSKLLGKKEFFEEAFDILDGVYRDRKAGSELAALHQRRVQGAESPEERLDMRRELANVLEEECKDPLAAQRVLQEALLDDLTDEGLRDEIERLLPITQAWSEAGQALVEGVKKEKKTIDAETARAICERAAEWQRDRGQNPEGAEAALRVALSFDQESDELLEQIESLQSVEGREADLLETVRRRANLATDESTKLELLRRAKELSEKTEQHDVAEEVLREIVGIDPEDLEALEGLTHLRRAAGDYAETYDLLIRRAEIDVDADKKRVLRFDAAEIARDQLERPEDAIKVLEELFDEDPEDASASEALRKAYDQAKRYDDLRHLTERLIDGSKDPAEAANLRVALAEVHLDKLGQIDRAVELLEGVFEEDPNHPQAALVLAKVYEEDERYQDLAGLLERQAKIAFEREDQPAGVEFLRRLAKLSEEELKDLPRALDAWQKVQQVEDKLEVREAILRLQSASGDKASAAQTLETIVGELEGQEAIDRRLELASLYKDLEDAEAVVRTLEATQALDPDNSELLSRLRSEYEQAGAWHKVAEMILQDAERAEADKSKIDLYREAATVHLEKQGDPQAAATVLEKATELAPDDRALLLELCDAYSAAGRGAESASVLEKVVESYGGKRSKELGEIHRRLATAYLSQGEQEKAQAELDKAFRIEPGNINILKQLGDLALETGDTKKAQQMFRALLLQRLDKNSPITKAQVFCRLGKLHQQLDEKAKAKQYFERALGEDKELQEAKEGLESL